MTYTEQHRALIRTLWSDNLSCAQIARRFNKAFDADITRSAVIGLANRMQLPKREGGGTWTAEGAAKRVATMKARGIPFGNKSKKPASMAPVASGEEPKPLGKPGQNPGECQWIAGDDPKTWVFCGHPKLAGTSWCSHHAQRCLPPKHSAQPPRKHIVMNPDRQFR